MVDSVGSHEDDPGVDKAWKNVVSFGARSMRRKSILSCVVSVSRVSKLKGRALSARLVRDDLATVQLINLDRLPESRDELREEVDRVEPSLCCRGAHRCGRSGCSRGRRAVRRDLDRVVLVMIPVDVLISLMLRQRDFTRAEHGVGVHRALLPLDERSARRRRPRDEWDGDDLDGRQ